ncbi:MAG: hypothetical protein AAEJ46_10035, partial [Planctomycetota bacterium]
MIRVSFHVVCLLLIFTICFSSPSSSLSAADDLKVTASPVKVFILAGQSNMEGHGQIRSLEMLGEDPVHG